MAETAQISWSESASSLSRTLLSGPMIHGLSSTSLAPTTTWATRDKPPSSTVGGFRSADGSKNRGTRVGVSGFVSSQSAQSIRAAARCGALGANGQGGAGRPWGAEPLGTLAKFYREQQLWRLCWEVCQLARQHTGVQPTGLGPDPEAIDRLFVHTDFYTWGVAFEESICAYYVNEIDRGRSLCQYLLDRDDLPPEERRYVQDNLRFYRT